MLRDNLERVRQRVQQACQRCGRHPSSVTLIGVTKTVPVERIQEALKLGLADLGENRVQEAREKQISLHNACPQGAPSPTAPALPSATTAGGCGARLGRSHLGAIRWHLIGPLQRNKVKVAVQLFDVIHSVDSRRLVEDLEHHMTTQDQKKSLPVFIQVNVSGEATKHGCRPEDTPALAHAVRQTSRLTLAGLMTIPPLTTHPEDTRPYFRRLRELRNAVAAACDIPPTGLQLSMGMSHDFEIAIEEGADRIRVGTAIFGGRG